MNDESANTVNKIYVDKNNLYININGKDLVIDAEQLLLSLFNKNTEIKIGRKKQAMLVLIDDINKNYKDYSILKAAEFLGISKCHFSRYFHKRTGVLFSQYMNYVRVANAVKLVQNDREMQLHEIAERCGFNNTRNLCRIFKQLTGFSTKKVPKDYIFNYKLILL